MGIARNALLWISENRRLRETLPNYGFIRKAVNRFMPGEELDDAVSAALVLQDKSITTIFTRLGENVTEEGMARGVADHYIEAVRKTRAKKLNTHISLKLTHLGLDLNESLCFENLERIAGEAERADTMLWIDMEQSPYVDRTLDMYSRLKQKHKKVGVCLQSYLYRTAADLKNLLHLMPAIRLVKGAYKESPSVAFPRKSDVDASFLALSMMLLENISRGVVFGIGTHDEKIIRRIQEEAARRGIQRQDYEFQLLYGIRSETQQQLAREGYKVRCLISYGNYWFPWYVRRLAERPANVWFVLKNIVS
ncbi:MAG: proline dehydrogenase family protein [Bacteroidota bacterium]